MAGCCMPVPSLHPPPFDFFFLCWTLPIQQYCTAVQQYCGYRSAVVVRNLSSTVLKSSKEVAAAVLHGVVVLK